MALRTSTEGQVLAQREGTMPALDARQALAALAFLYSVILPQHPDAVSLLGALRALQEGAERTASP